MSLILLPAIAYILLTRVFVRRMAAKDLSEALVKAHIVLFTFVALSTELLSLIHGISFPALLTAWLLFLLLCLVAMFRYRSERACLVTRVAEADRSDTDSWRSHSIHTSHNVCGSDSLSAQHLGLHDIPHVSGCPLDQQQRNLFYPTAIAQTKLPDASCRIRDYARTDSYRLGLLCRSCSMDQFSNSYLPRLFSSHASLALATNNN